MTSGTDASGTGPSDGALREAPSARELAEYRAALESLMQRCLARVRSMDLPVDAEPLQQRSADDCALR